MKSDVRAHDGRGTVRSTKPATRGALAAFAVCTLVGGASGLTARGSEGIDIVPMSSVFLAIPSANTVTVTTAALSRSSDLTHRLIDAADRGARISVALDTAATGSAATENEALATELALHNVDMRRVPATGIKLAVVDDVVYLSDRNWPGTSTEQMVVRDVDPTDRRVLERAIVGGRPGSTTHLWTRKADALSAEAAVIASRTSGEIDVESTTFGAGTPVFEALMRRADSGDDVRLLVGRRTFVSSRIEQQAVVSLLERHVEVRLTPSDGRMAIEGYNIFFGSADATRDGGNAVDYGIALRDAEIATQLHAAFDAAWKSAAPLRVPAPVHVDIEGRPHA